MSTTDVWTRVAGRTRDMLRSGLRALESPLAPEFYAGLEAAQQVGFVDVSIRIEAAHGAECPHRLEDVHQT